MPPETARRTAPENQVIDAPVLETSTVYAHFPLRIALFAVFAYHATGKFVDLEGFAAMMGFSTAVAVIVALMELGIAAFILVGAFGFDFATRVAGLLTMGVMGGAIAQVHWGRWSFVPTDAYPMGGMEFQVTLALIGLYFLLRGNRV